MIFIEVFEKMRLLHSMIIIYFTITNKNYSMIFKIYVLEFVILHNLYYTLNTNLTPWKIYTRSFQRNYATELFNRTIRLNYATELCNGTIETNYSIHCIVLIQKWVTYPLLSRISIYRGFVQGGYAPAFGLFLKKNEKIDSFYIF